MLTPRVIDVIRRCQEMGIQYAVYQSGLADQLTFGTPLVFASMEHADSSEFRTYLYRMELAQQLDRIVLDEAHLVLTAASYRAKLEAALQLRHLQCQLIYLTATLPPIMMSAFEQRLGLRNPEIIRSITFRKDIRLRVDQQPNHFRASFEDWCYSEIVRRAQPRDDQSRFIIYCRYKGECESLAKLLKCEFYHSSAGSDKEKGSIFKRWLDGKHGMICCTQAFGAGLDYSRVDGVFFVGAWNDPLEFLQAMGRAGRSGQGAFCITLLDRGWKSPLSARIEPLIGPEELVVEHSLLGKECRAKALSEYVDGVAWCCENVANRCDVCEQRGNLNADFHGQAGGPGQCSQSAVREDKGEEELDSGIESEHVTSLRTPMDCEGSQIVLSQARESAHELEGFLEGLRLMIGRCGLCQVLKHDARHLFDQCARTEKRSFFQAKRLASNMRLGWIESFVVCYGCYMPQGLCPQLGKKVQGQWVCEFRDLVGPMAWAAYQDGVFRDHVIREWTGQGFTDEKAYMLWLGKKTRRMDMDMANMTWITSLLVKEVIRKID